MSTPLPVTRGTSAALYPFTLTISFDTAVQQFQNGAQQRWARRRGLATIDLNYEAFTQAQKNTFKAAFQSAKGRFDNTLSLAFGGVTYSNLAFDADELAFTESETMQYGSRIRLVQTLTGTWTPGTSGTDFPVLANGAMGQLPYTQKNRYQNIVNRMPAGPQYSYAEFGGGITGFPGSGGLMAWDFDERNLSDTDLATRVNHFIANYGRLKPFKFTDEDSTAYTKTHYASDTLTVNYQAYNNSAVKIALEATY